MPKISELNAITSVANTDLLMVVHDPNGSPSTNKITVNNFISSVGSQLRGYTGSAGTGGGTGTLPDDGLNGQILFSNGTSSVWKFNPDVKAINAIYDRTSYTATEDDCVLLVVPATQGQAITITLPGNVPVGKTYVIRNIDSSNGQFPVIVNTVDVVGLIEDPHFGTIVNEYYIRYSGDTEYWIFDGNYYRSFSQLSNSPVFKVSANSYHQVVIQNYSNANNASADWVAYNDAGDYVQGVGPFVDMGINSSDYTDTFYGNVWGPNDAYVYNDGGNLIIGPDSDHTIKFVAGGTNVENIQMTINSTSVAISNIAFNDTTISYIGDNTGVLKSKTGLGVSVTSDAWSQLMWLPDITNATLDEISSGGNAYCWAYTYPSGFYIENYNVENSPDERSWHFDNNGILNIPNDIGDIYRNGASVLGTGQIDGGNAFTTPTAEITVDGGGA